VLVTVPTSRHATPARCLFWAAIWLAAALILVKAYFLGLPAAVTWADGRTYLRSLAAISYVDVLFAAVLWAAGRSALALAGRRQGAARVVTLTFVCTTSLCCLYAAANAVIFGAFGGFLTYPLLTLVGSVRMLGSSAAAYITPGVVIGLLAVPVGHLALVGLTLRLTPLIGSARPGRAFACACLSAGVWMFFGQHTFATDWSTRQERRVAENPHWVLVSSVWHAASGAGTVRLDGAFLTSDLADFEPPGQPPGTGQGTRPPNVVIVVLESVGARWTSLHGRYETTPRLESETERGMVFESFYAHTGRSSNSLASILLSTYPRLGFSDLTQEYPRRPGTSLAQVFSDRGYRTAFVTASDLSWAGWDAFLEGRGFQELRDQHDLSCGEPVSSWGVEDRCMLEDLMALIAQDSTRPFFFMGWSQQTHHPYEAAPGVPLLEFTGEPMPDAYGLNRYLTVLGETDRHLGRLFDALRRARLDKNTLVVVTGDHGQAFGYPHQSYMQGRTIYEEDVQVPLMLWFPPRYRTASRSRTIGGHVDLAPTVADLAGVPAAADWLGRSLLSASDPRRAYFYVADDEFTLGVREANWKYILDLRDGVEELYDLDADPLEQDDVAAAHPERSARLRQRLVAWTEANRRQYEVP
jgi:arylsulfatase A-like enzyme